MSRDTSFYYSFLVLPPAKRDAIVAVWDFCRAVDDAVDEPGAADPQALLEGWRREIERSFGGGAGRRRRAGPCSRSSPGSACRVVRSRTSSTASRWICASRDMRPSRRSTSTCWRVASTVGLICLEIFGYTRPESREYAVNLGVALQLTNIIRDVRVDLERGRIYLPQDDMRRFGVTEADLRDGRVTEPVRAAARPRLRACARVLPRGRSAAAARRTRGRSWPPRSCAASTARYSTASSERGTTCSARPFACPARAARRLPPPSGRARSRGFVPAPDVDRHRGRLRRPERGGRRRRPRRPRPRPRGAAGAGRPRELHSPIPRRASSWTTGSTRSSAATTRRSGSCGRSAPTVSCGCTNSSRSR